MGVKAFIGSFILVVIGVMILVADSSDTASIVGGGMVLIGFIALTVSGIRLALGKREKVTA